MTISTEKQSRRAALGALASVPVLALPVGVATVPAAGAIASPKHPDASLFALQADIEAADRLKEASFGPLNTAEEAYLTARAAPLPPKPEGAAFTNEEWFHTFKEKVAELSACPSPEAAAHLAACKAWAEEDERLHVETGLTAAEERSDEIDADISALRDEIVATRATTLAGLKFKAKYAVDHYPGEPDQDVMDSIVDDILAMCAGGQDV